MWTHHYYNGRTRGELHLSRGFIGPSVNQFSIAVTSDWSDLKRGEIFLLLILEVLIHGHLALLPLDHSKTKHYGGKGRGGQAGLLTSWWPGSRERKEGSFQRERFFPSTLTTSV